MIVDIEKLADLEHERWSGWMKYLFTKGQQNEDGTFIIDADSVRWWQKIMNTPYAALSERSKESDRAEVRKTVALLEQMNQHGT